MARTWARWNEVLGTLLSEQYFEIASGQLHVSHDLRNKAGADHFAGVDRHRSHATIWVAQKVMAASGASNFESRTFQCRNQVLSVDPKAWCHEAMRTR